MINFLKSLYNFWIFRKEIYNYKWNTPSTLYQLMLKSLTIMEDNHTKNKYIDEFTKFRILSNIKACKITLQRIDKNDYSPNQLETIYSNYMKEKNKVALFATKLPTKVTNEIQLYNTQVMNLKKQDWDVFLKCFKTSEQWWG